MVVANEDIARVYVLDAYNKLKTGSLIQIIANSLLILSLTTISVMIFRLIPLITELTPSTLPEVSIDNILINEILKRFSMYIIIMSTSIIVLIASLILWIISTWACIIPGARRLTYVDNRFSRACNLINLGWFWGVVVAFIGGAISIGSIFANTLIPLGLSVIAVSLILTTLGYAGIIILSTKLSDYEKIDRFETTSTLFILSIAIPYISFLPWLTFYRSLQYAINKYRNV